MRSHLLPGILMSGPPACQENGAHFLDGRNSRRLAKCCLFLKVYNNLNSHLTLATFGFPLMLSGTTY